MEQHLTKMYQRLLISLFLLCTLTMATSCGSDEPDWLVGYYMTINSQVRISLSEEDESQGTSSQPIADVLSNTIVKMRNALHEAYPVNGTTGNDAAVIAALDDIYRQYKLMYGGDERNTVCVVKLYRAAMDGEIVMRSTPLKTYHFGARPANMDE
ncbi:MAG: hypothetical protein IKW85_08260 [Muribaculaceae bacterium]|nr:hypothetical protein [Muribaculaceae bacterium]